MDHGTRVGRAVEHVVALRLARSAVASPRALERLKQVEQDLRQEIGAGVPKKRAAAVLGVSVTALDKWIGRGRLPVVRRPGTSREQIDTDALLELAEEVTRLRESGGKRGLLAASLARLSEEERPRPKLRLSRSARELREHDAPTAPSERLGEIAELSEVLTNLAARGAKAARRERSGE
jgi:hypothetical protein